MTKKMLILSVGMFFALIPLSSAMLRPSDDALTFDQQNPLNDAPDWASGYFTGVVGVTTSMGRPTEYGGYIVGYYAEEGFKGRFAGLLAEKNATKINGGIVGYIAGPFLFGVLSNTTTEKTTPLVGIGLRNETHLYFRMMGLVGPTFYMAASYQSLL